MIVSALIAAVGKRNAQIVRLLIESGADINVKNNDGITPLMAASYEGYQDIVAILKGK